MIKKIIFGIAILLSTSCFANSTTSDGSKKDAAKTNDATTQKIIDDFSAYAGTIKPEVRKEIQEYRVEIVDINKKKRELYNSLSKEAQNFLAEQQNINKNYPSLNYLQKTTLQIILLILKIIRIQIQNKLFFSAVIVWVKNRHCEQL